MITGVSGVWELCNLIYIEMCKVQVLKCVHCKIESIWMSYSGVTQFCMTPEADLHCIHILSV